MPPQLLFDISTVDLNHVKLDQEAIRKINPQRGAMEHLNGIIRMDVAANEILGFKDVRADEFWVEGHIPGRPLLPGVIMIEAAAQLASLFTHFACGWDGFIGFGGVKEVKFRAPVTPGCRMYLLGKKTWERHHRLGCATQGIVNGNVVFEAEVIGTVV
jgi:3-hydroxyacyl-[acyl-carrier-protein] dehydratase